MKKIMIINFWFNMLAWILFLNHFTILSFVMMIANLIYNYFYLKGINIWRLLFVYGLLMIVGLFYIKNSNLHYLYNHLYSFFSLIMINNAILNEIFYILKINKMLKTYLILTFSTFITIIMALLIPNSNLLPNLKYDILTVIFIIFFPSFIEMNICFIYKYLIYIKDKKKVLINIK